MVLRLFLQHFTGDFEDCEASDFEVLAADDPEDGRAEDHSMHI